MLMFRSFKWCFVFFGLYSTGVNFVIANPSDGDVRLTDGGAPNQGRIEYYFNETWWTLCSNYFHGDVHNTVCRKLGYNWATQHYRDSEFGAGNLSILHTSFYCDYGASSLLNCTQGPWYEECHGGVVGVVCDEMVFAECYANLTDISGQLVFKRGPKPQETLCKWTIQNPNGYQVIVNLQRFREHCGTPEVKIWNEWNEMENRHNCQDLKTPVLWFFSATYVTLVVRIWDDYNYAPPFVAGYVLMKGDLSSAPGISGWNFNILNVTEKSFYVHWQGLTNEISQPVKAYIIHVSWSNHYGGYETTGKILPSNVTSEIIDGLDGFSDYTVVVFAVDGLGNPHKSSTTNVKTLEGSPSESPSDVRIDSITTNSVRIQWHPISEHAHNGHLLGYTIRYHSSCYNQGGRENVSASTTSYTLSGLRTGARYDIWIAGYTLAGIGHESHRDIFTSCEAQTTLTDNNGTIQSPGYPCEYGGFQYCNWAIRPSGPASSILIEFHQMSLSVYHHYQFFYCRLQDYLAFSSAVNKNASFLCDGDVNYVLVSSSQADLTFSALHDKRSSGFKATYEILQSNFTAVTALSSWNVSERWVKEHEAEVEWTEFPGHGEYIAQFALMVKELNKDISRLYLVYKHDRNRHIQELIPNRVYVAQILAFNGSLTDGPSYSSKTIIITTPPGAPSVSPVFHLHNLQSGNAIVVVWRKIPPERQHGVINGYNLYYREQHHHEERKMNISSSETRVTLFDLQPLKEYEIAIEAFTSIAGPRSEWQTIVVGCGGTFNQSYGMMNLSKSDWDWETRECSWTIYNPGIENAVLLMSIWKIKFHNCGYNDEYATILKGDQEAQTHRGCDPLRLDMTTVPFGDSNFLKAEVRIQNPQSRVWTSFVIVKGGLESAIDPPTESWGLTAEASGKSLLVNWSSFPNDLNAVYFIVSLNQTEIHENNDHHYDHENYNPIRMLRFFNVSETEVNVSGIPAATEFQAVVYLVALNNDIYKSERLTIKSAEGVPREAPYIHDWRQDFDARSISFRLESIEESNRGGKILGYKLRYHRFGRSGETVYQDLDVNTEQVTLNNLIPGKVYVISISGYTSAGEGKTRTVSAALCGGVINAQMGNISSPGYPNTPYRPEDQHDDNIRCHWRLRPPTGSYMMVTLKNFFLGRREWNYCSGQLRVHFPDRDWDESKSMDFCGKETNYSILIKNRDVDIQAWGFHYHRHDDEFSKNNGTKFLVEFKAFSEEDLTGSVLGDWEVTITNVTNSSALVSWPPPPSSFAGGATVEGYLLIGDQASREIYHPTWLSASQSAHLVENLLARTNYTGKIVVILSNGTRGSTDWKSFQTKEGIPSRNPRIHEREAIDFSTLWIRWEKLEESARGGTLLGYRVHVEQNYHGDYRPINLFFKVVTVGPDEFEYNITGLPQWTEFQVWVTAYTAAGEGIQQNKEWMRTKCGWWLNSTTDFIRSPGYPNEMIYSECVWYIQSRNKSVLLWFVHADIEHDCERHFVAVGDDSGVQPKRWCGVTFEHKPVLVQAHTVPLLYESHNHISNQRKGFELVYIVLNESTWEATLAPNWSIFNITKIDLDKIVVEWHHHPPVTYPLELFAYSVVCTPTDGKLGPTLTTVRGNMNRTEVHRLRPGTNFSVEIVALIYNNQTEEITLEKSQSEDLETDEGVPSERPSIERTNTYLDDSTFFYITWRPIPHDKWNGNPRGYKVFYRAGDTGAFHTKSVPPDALEANITIESDPAPYEIRVAAFTRAGDGPMSDPRERRAYQADVIGRMGVFTSPGFPQTMPGNLECYWGFHPVYVPQRFRMVVAFEAVYLRDSEGAPNCTNLQNDWMGVARINPLRFISGPFCGTYRPFAVLSWEHTTDTPYMGFFTGDGPANRGFNATYFVVFDVSKISLSLVSGTITDYNVQMAWTNTGIPEQIKEYFIFYKPVKEENQQIKNGWSFTRSPQPLAALAPLQPATEYSVFVLGYTSSGKVYGSNDVNFTTTGVIVPTTTMIPTTPPVKRLYPYEGDTLIGFKLKCERIKIPRGGIRIYGKRHRECFICPNGVIQFERNRINQRPYPFGQRWWLRFRSIIAPYWTRVDLGRSFTNSISKVYYHIYTGQGAYETLSKATSDVLSVYQSKLPEGKTFQASWVCVVTWVNLRPADLNDFTETLGNTFQAVIVTDNIFSFVIFNYPHNGIQYSAPTSRSNYKYFTDYEFLPVIGFNAGDDENNFLNIKRSGTVEAESIDNLPGNQENIPGRWIMRLENSAGEEDSDFNCVVWLEKHKLDLDFTNSTKPDPCPCTLDQARVDDRYTWVESIFPYTRCYYTVRRSSSNHGRKCCYFINANKLGALIIGPRRGGTIDRFHKLVPELKDDHTESDVLGFQYCCIGAIKRGRLCKLYYQLRPSEGCEAYVPPVQAPTFGDPHVVTLDGRNYTFNGLGEYTMIDINDEFFQLQARTKLAKGGGTATIFAAAVAKEESTSTVQVALKEGGGLEVLIDGQPFNDYDGLTNSSVFVNGSLALSRPESNSFVVTFPSGISVTVTELQGSLTIVCAAPTSFKGNTKGLLGTWNDDTLDDFLRPDGTTLPSNATGRQIHFDFGLHWQVMENTTLFTYNPGENTSTYANASFVPIFLDEPINFATNELRVAAELACQGDVNCLFDIASTGDVSVGESTKQVAVQIESESQALENFPPRILTGPTEVNVTVNETATIIVTAEDPNNDSLTFTLSGTLPAGYTTTSDALSITLTWRVTSEEIEVDFIVSDGTATTVLSPVIYVCACLNDGSCFHEEEDSEENNANNTERFNILSCACKDGYTGSFCDSDLDACEENSQPCYPGVTCTDLPPPANETGFQCDPCPSGYSGDGIDCKDIDECSVNKGGCQHNCINTPGSLVCKCDDGYYLDADKKSCQDVNECSPASDCMHQCENTAGGYNCQCDENFKVDPADSKKCIPENVCTGQHGCQQVCYQADGQDKCSCLAGYELNQDGTTCSDINECETGKSLCTQTCSNRMEGYNCSCADGFSLDSDGYTCNDIDECREFTFQCQDDSQICSNLHGSYKCVCGEDLYWIDNKCQGLGKGEAPPPPPPASTPRTPSAEETAESVSVNVGLNISGWNKPKEDAFKQSVAQAATDHCLTGSNCQSTETSSRRKRRSAGSLVFTENQVHVLPGYPKQISVSPLLANISFYIQSPAGSSFTVMPKAVVVAIVQSSLASISSALNANISSVQTLFADTTTATSSTPPITTATTRVLPTEKESNVKYIIAGCVASGVVIIIIVVTLVWWCNKKKREKPRKIDSELSIVRKVKTAENMEMNDTHSPSNEAFENDTYIVGSNNPMPDIEQQAPNDLKSPA